MSRWKTVPQAETRRRQMHPPPPLPRRPLQELPALLLPKQRLQLPVLPQPKVQEELSRRGQEVPSQRGQEVPS
jgi:hypothetical protein